MPEVEEPGSLAGVPDAFQRLWTPHRMVYIEGENKPADSGAGSCPFCRAPERDDVDALVVHRGETAYAVLNLYPYSPGHLLLCPYRHIADWTEATPQERAELGELTATAMTVLVTSGERTGSPRCTALMPATRSAGSVSLSRKPFACCRSARLSS